MQITRYASLSEQQFLGCVSAFADSLTGELNSAAMFLRKLAGQPKGAAFAYEMSLDRHRYGALTVLDRWAPWPPPLDRMSAQPVSGDRRGDSRPGCDSAEGILENANRVIDAAESYGNDLVEVCLLAFQSLAVTFAEEAESAGQSAKLGPMLPEEYKQARAIFLQDLAAR